MPAYAIEIEHRETDQVFSYYHGDKLLHFNASLLGRMHKQMASEFRRITLEVTQAEYDLCMQHRGIEEPKVARLTPENLAEPGYGVVFADRTFSIVDGHHRLVRLYRDGVRAIDLFVCIPEVWAHCLVEYTEEGDRKIAESLPPKIDDPTGLASKVKVHKQ